jgi:DNA uptake protein ComE-like DNA-binding protein
MRLQALLVFFLLCALHPADAQISFAQQMAHHAAPPEPLDINLATPRQLNALPGFGPAYTRRIIAGRPYTAKNQLATRGVIPQGAYERVSALIVAHRVSAQSSGNSHPAK